MSTDNIIDVIIDRQTQAGTQAGHGTAMFLDVHTNFPERVKLYLAESFLSDMIADGFIASDPAVIAAVAYFGQQISPSQIKIGRTDGVETLTAAWAAIQDEDDDFYGVGLYTSGEAEVLEMAALVEASSKIFGVTSSDSSIKSGLAGNLALDLAPFSRTFLCGSNDDTIYATAMAAMGYKFAHAPGASTWMFSQLQSVPTQTLTPSEKATMHGQFANTLTKVGGYTILETGTMGNGEFIDIIRGVDWLHDRMSERILRIMVVEGVSISTGGIAQIESAIMAQLEEAVRVGFLLSYTVTAPLLGDISAPDRAARKLSGFKFEAVLDASAHSAVVRGAVVV